MKLQYLGDSKDAFKWDYHDYLTSTLRSPTLNIMPMLTPDDGSYHGKTPPERFCARDTIIKFCSDLKKRHDLRLIYRLPIQTGASYQVLLHKESTFLTNENREEYFSGLSPCKNQVLFLDPDNGFEPDKSSNEKHVLYADIKAILEQATEETVVSVFHHFRRILFDKDYARIKERLQNVYTTAIYWQSLMFVTMSISEKTIERVIAVNRQYLQGHPIKTLD